MVEEVNVVGNVYEEDSMQSPEDINTTIAEDTHQAHHHHNYNNIIIIDSEEFLLLNQHQQLEGASTRSDGNDINGLQDHLLGDDNELLPDNDIIFEDQMATSTWVRALNEGAVINTETATAAYETVYEFEKIPECDPSPSYKQEPQKKYNYLLDDDYDAIIYVDDDEIINVDDDEIINADDPDDILQDFSNYVMEDEDVNIDDDSVIELETSTTKNLNKSDDGGVPDSLIKKVLASVNSASPFSVNLTETDQRQTVKSIGSSPHTRIPIIDTSQRSPNSKRKTIEEHTGPLRYKLFDDLIATIVDFDADDTPIVEFSLSSSKSDNLLPVECGICPKVMKRSEMSTHLQVHHVPETDRYACIYCTKSYPDYKYLACHARRHMGIRPYICGECKLYFSTKQDLRVHDQRRHIVKEYTCEVCGKNFAQNTLLKRHRESMHEMKSRYQCVICPKSYYKNFTLKEHIRNVHMGKRRILDCHFCGMEFRDPHKLSQHRKDNHLNQSVYNCHVCCEEFTDINYFDAHKRSIQCRSNTKRTQESLDEEILLNEVENEETSTISNATTNQSSYASINSIVSHVDYEDEAAAVDHQMDEEQLVVYGLDDEQHDLIYEVYYDDDVHDDDTKN